MKVLLVDDESYMTEYLKKLVDWKSYGFEEVLTASGGSIARDLIEQKKPELLVTDIRMPRVSGLDLVKYIDEKNYLIRRKQLFCPATVNLNMLSRRSAME